MLTMVCIIRLVACHSEDKVSSANLQGCMELRLTPDARPRKDGWPVTVWNWSATGALQSVCIFICRNLVDMIACAVAVAEVSDATKACRLYCLTSWLYNCCLCSIAVGFVNAMLNWSFPWTVFAGPGCDASPTLDPLHGCQKGVERTPIARSVSWGDVVRSGIPWSTSTVAGAANIDDTKSFASGAENIDDTKSLAPTPFASNFPSTLREWQTNSRKASLDPGQQEVDS